MSRTFSCTKTDPIVQTRAGKLRGFVVDGTYTFHGIRYAVAKRFHQPQPVAPWEGVKNALAYGYVCPLLEQDKPSNEVMIPHRYWPMDENCQYLNIWTQSLNPEAKKPVMVWLHGGGFFAGSSIEQVAYEGENLSKYGDVVVVSLNHRLNILGYLDLSAYGEEYANSANAGTADMVAALQWIHDNIASFGGDPENVTIFGQSGGGMKVWTLMQTPAADGLFHRGVIQSGIIHHFMDCGDDDGTALAEALMEATGCTTIRELEAVPYPQLAAAYCKVSPALEEKGCYVGGNPRANGWYEGEPLVVGLREHAKSIPVMIGTVLGEFSFMPALSAEEKADKALMDAKMRKRYGKQAAQVQKAFHKVYPDKDPTDALFLDSVFRAPTIDFVAQKSQFQQAPTYSYLMTYTSPYDGGHIAWHCCEIPYVFHNVNLVPVCNDPGVSDLLEQQLCDAWLNFARTGNPNNPHLPHWPACIPGDEACMIFDTSCQVRHNHDHELIRLHTQAAPQFRSDLDEEQEIQH